MNIIRNASDIRHFKEADNLITRQTQRHRQTPRLTDPHTYTHRLATDEWINRQTGNFHLPMQRHIGA